ncbi:MAG: DUF417 family protein [Ginsengibacter sp.]
MTTIIRNDNAVTLERLGTIVIRYALVITLLWVGSLKFTTYEAMGVHGHAVTSPFLSWLANMMTVQSFSELIGVIEIILGFLIAIKPVAPKISYYGSLGSIIMFLITLSFIFTDTDVWQTGYGFPAASPAGQFLLKDLLFFGAAIFTAGDALKASQNHVVFTDMD